MGLSLWEAVTLLPAFGWILGKAVLIAALAPLRLGRSRSKSYGVYVQHRISNTAFNTLSARQLQFLIGPWISTYKAHQKKLKKTADVEKIPGTSIEGAWFGDKNKAKTILVYYHGGGFAMPGLPMHADMLTRWERWCGGKLAIFMPGYTTTPNAVYPQALGEMVEATRFILEGVGKDKDVLIAGDSAGGQLCVAILSHVSGHPHPDKAIVKPLDLKGRKFRGALALAPWTSSDTIKFPSMLELSTTDMIDKGCVDYWSELWKAGRPDDEYIVPEMASIDWWKGITDVTDDVLVCAGGDEILRDAIKSWASKLEQAIGKQHVRLVVAPGESHDEPLTPKSKAFLATEVTGKELSQEGAILNWLKQHTT